LPTALDSLVRRVDEDRWLASRFAPADVRARLIAIYAVNYEIARTAESVSEAALGDIRLRWWAEAIGDVHDGKPPRSHPALAAYAEAHRRTPLPREAIEGIVDARRSDLDPAPFDTAAAFDAYLDATAGNVMRLAIAACSEDAGADAALAARAGWLWGCVGLLRSRAHWHARGRNLLPRDGGSIDRLRARAEQETRALRSERVAAASLPAFGYVRLARGYLAALKSGRTEQSLLARQLSLVIASATGRL
jgi:15-cis-phytoene synthase